MLEFVLTSIPLIFSVVSLLWLCIGIWQYHTLAEAVNVTARYAAVHGADCAGQTCATTVEGIIGILESRAIGIPPASLNVTLTSQAQNYTCNPATSCASNAGAWPSLAGNAAISDSNSGTNITIQASYLFSNPISIWLPVEGTVQFGSVTLTANSTQPVLY